MKKQLPIFLFILVIIIGISLRFYNLDVRPFHHDESLNSIYGLYYYLDPTSHYYKYNPLLHGPLLYNILPFIYSIFGVDKFGPRVLMAILGSCFIFIPFLFRRYISKPALLIITIYISFSPSLIYWSRYVRHDYLFVFFSFFIIWGATTAPQRVKSLFILPGIAFLFTIKENSFVTLAIMTGYLCYEYFFSKYLLKQTTQNRIKQFVQHVRSNIRYFVPAVLISMFIFVWLYSARFSYIEGVLDGLYRKSISYWFTQHSIQRISGPFSYTTLILLIYDFPFVLFAIMNGANLYFNISKNLKITASMLYIACLILYICHRLFNISFLIPDFLHLKLKIDLLLFLILLIHSIFCTSIHLYKKEKVLAFWGYLFWANLFTYSFLGEKVPWLAMYPLIIGLIYFSLQIKKSKYNLYLVPILTIYLFVQSIQTNYTNSGKASSLMSQVHTTKTFEDIILGIQSNSSLENPPNFSAKVLLTGAATWPSTWFFYQNKNIHYHYNTRTNLDHDYIFYDKSNFTLEDQIAITHTIESIPLRSWWKPSYKTTTIKQLANYILFQKPWSKTGTQFVNLARKN